MNQRREADKHLRCTSCGEAFVFSLGEQELFRLRGVTSEPTHCPNCARGRTLATTLGRSTNQHAAR
jgi:hypothetical protein